MAKICVYLHGEPLSELALTPGQEFFAGRSTQCHIHLASERGISRQHVKFFEQDGVWHAQLLSKYGGMIVDGQNVETLQLKGTTRFSVPPYDFMFEETPAVAVIDMTVPTHEVTNPTPAEAEAEAKAEAEEKPTPAESSDAKIDVEPAREDRTVVAQTSRLIPYLKIINNKLKTEEVLKLEGNLWRVGRSPENEIVINDSAISRKHLELVKKDNQYFVVDHGSSNGTHHNGLKIEAENPQLLKSGDVLTIRHLELILEIHDNAYEEGRSLPVIFEDTSFEMTSGGLVPVQSPSIQSSSMNALVQKIEPWHSKEKLKKRLTPIAIGAFVLIALIHLTRPNTPPSQPTGSQSSASKTGVLTVEQQKQVVDFFNLAHNYYTQRKYTLCLSQLDRMKKLTPFYLNSKELENLCEQGQEDEARALDRQRRKQEQEKTQEQIQENVDQCRGKLSPTITVAQMRNCLDQAIQLNPGSPLVTDLLNQANIREQQAKSEQERAEEYAQRKSEGRHVFASAESSFKNGHQERALIEFKKFVHEKYPGLNQQEDVATRRIASIKRSIDEKVRTGLSACQSDINSDNLKAALKECDAVLRESPNDMRAQDLRRKAYRHLSDEMKSIYEDSVLEENMGNLDSAKDKWIRIVHQSVPGENYYEKARSKLRQYGVEL